MEPRSRAHSKRICASTRRAVTSSGTVETLSRVERRTVERDGKEWSEDGEKSSKAAEARLSAAAG